ncbi:hypothetical protein KO519_07275 [Paraglaciecola agarilytica]|uniref:hypothetical protein n=1 Tax=Paraglaciecola chathamensis TaxID=368405 RepID=UPI001C09EF25|nr:hypothetical protein [Paraglaciecola agarilytica]MBU3017496.1 hypothetical protein [Paraglaciecola agarilytica]
MYKLALTTGLFLLNGNALAAYTEAKACDTCDYDDAVRLAKTYHRKLNCQITGLNGNNIEFGATTYQCNDTSKEIIITNALTQTAYKFNVSATQQSQYSSAALVTATNTSMNSIEREALEEFYEIDSQFRRAVRNAGNIVTPRSVSSSVHSYNLKGQHSNAFSSASSSGSEDCLNHPSAYLTSPLVQRDIENEIRQQITDEIDDNSWSDYFEDTDFAGGSVQIGAGTLGLSLSLSNDKIKAFSTKVYGEDPNNALTFEVAYQGEVEIRGERSLRLSLGLSRGASLVDGMPIGTFMSGTNVDLTDGLVSNCLIKNIESIAGATIKVTTSSGGGCTKQVNYTTCSTAHGVRSCTEGSVRTNC